MVEEALQNGWEIVPYVYRGEQRGVVAMRGSEIHFELQKSPAVLRHSVRDFLAGLMEREGFLTTRVPHGEEREVRFVQKMGFRKTWSDERFDYFLMTDLPFGKEKINV